jgi:hypothetical protein
MAKALRVTVAANDTNKSNPMLTKKKYLPWLRIGFLGLVSSAQLASAQNFTASTNGDLIAGFRKTGANAGNYELVVDLGSVTNLLAMSTGATVTMSNLTSGVLSDSFPTGNGNLQWSVFSYCNRSASVYWTNSFGVFPSSTVWYTLSSGTNTTTQTTPPARNPHSSQALLDARMWSVVFGAETISAAPPDVTNADNNSFLVREPASDDGTQTTLNDFIAGDQNNPGLGDFGGSTINYSVECTNPASFTSPTRSDFYQSCPDSGGTTYTDPITGQTTGNCYLVGYFLMNPNGTMTFTRAQTNSSSGPPPAPVLSIQRSGNTSTISFNTTNGANYTLVCTNSGGLSTPRSTWPVVGSSITGAGGSTNFTDTTTDTRRVYSVIAH